MQNVALVPLKPFDGKHFNYKKFKKEFFAMYHNRTDDVVVRMTQLRGLLTDNVEAVVSETTTTTILYGNAWTKNMATFLCSPRRNLGKCWTSRQ